MFLSLELRSKIIVMKLSSVSRDFMLSFASLFDPQLSVLGASLSERNSVFWMRCRAT